MENRFVATSALATFCAARSAGCRRRRPTLGISFGLGLLVIGCLPARGATVWLSSLDLGKVHQGWGTPHADQSVEGHPLTIAGRKFEHGLGTHSVGAVMVALQGGSSRFHAWVGIDDETQGKGSVEFKVSADGKSVWSSGVMKGGAAAKEVDVDATGIKELALRVGDAGDGFEFDHADWADASFEVTGERPRTFERPPTEPVIAMTAPAGAVAPVVNGDGQPRTPPMGWNSYDGFGDSVTEAEMRANAEAVARHLKAHGWRYIVVDYCWFDPAAHNNSPNEHAGARLPIDAFGRLLPAVSRFPSAASGRGFKPLADAVHALGLRFGIHIMRGIPRVAVETNAPIEGSSFTARDAANTEDKCSWCPFMYGVRGATPAGQAWYDSIFRQYAQWDLDFVKVDDLTSPYRAEEVQAVHEAIANCGRPIVFSTSLGETPIEQAGHVAANAEMWRATGDFWDEWRQLDYAFGIAHRWTGHGGPGHWPDLDMLPLGHLSVRKRSVGDDRQTRFTRAEQVTLLTLWSIAPSPLMMGGNFADADAWEIALLSNDEVLAVNQDAAARQGHRVSSKEGLELWLRDLQDGSRALALFNRTDDDARIRAALAELGLTGRFHVRDIWQRKDLPATDSLVEVFVPSHGAALLRLTKAD